MNTTLLAVVTANEFLIIISIGIAIGIVLGYTIARSRDEDNIGP